MMTKTQQIIAGLLKSAEVKRAMHGYPDYQMTEPQQPPVPQMSLPGYDLEEQEPPSKPLSFPGEGLLTGGLLGGGLGAGWQQGNITKSMERLKFLRGAAEAGAPSVNMTLLDAVQRGVPPQTLGALRQALTTPQGIEAYYEMVMPGAGAKGIAAGVSKNRQALLQALGKGPGLGLLGGAALGIGGGLLAQQFGKESSFKPGFLVKWAFRAPPPASQEIPDAWRAYKMKNPGRVFSHESTQVAPYNMGRESSRASYHPAAFEPTQLAHMPQQSQTRVTRGPAQHAAPAATSMAAVAGKSPGLLGKLKGILGMVGRGVTRRA